MRSAKLVSLLLAALFPLSVIIGGIFLHRLDPAPLVSLRLQLFDTYQRLAPRDYTPMPVTIIDIDERALQEYGQWPWPRSLMATLTDTLRAHNAAALGLDIVFAEPDRVSPSALLPTWEFIAPQVVNAAAIPDNDIMFADAIAEFNVVGGIVLDDASPAPLTRRFGIVTKGDSPAPFVESYGGALTNIALITEAAQGHGALNAHPDADGIIRRVPLIMRAGNNIQPGLAAEVLRIAQGASTYIISSAPTGITNVRIGNITIPTDTHGNVWVHYTPFTDERYVSAAAILRGETAELEGHLLLLGTSAAGLKDIRATPLNQVTNGVEIHAQALEQILLGHYLYRPDWLPSAELTGMVAAALLVWVLVAKTAPFIGALATLICLFAAFVASWWAFTQQHMLIDPSFPALIILILYIGESLRRYMLAEKERATVRDAFSRYMSPALVEKLAAQPDQLTLGGEMRDMTVLFCDIRGFTTISEQYDAQGLTQFINRFLTPMTDIIMARQGTIDKYIGDCIMAFWNAPLDDADHARHGCNAALAMMNALDMFNKDEAQQVRIGIGLNTDMCCVGNMGSAQRFDYSVLGDGVNLASRLEGQSKFYGVDIVIGEATCRAVPDYATLELDVVRVKGKQRAVRIYALCGDATLATSTAWQNMVQANAMMLEHYRTQDWESALCWLSTLEAASIDKTDLSDYLRLYRMRITDYQHTPPPTDWDGVYVAVSK